MNKQDLIEVIASTGNISKNTAGEVIDAVFGGIADSLGRGEAVSLIGFGTFDVGSRAARQGRNPQTGETIQIAASKTVRFKPGKPLKDKVNK